MKRVATGLPVLTFRLFAYIGSLSAQQATVIHGVRLPGDPSTKNPPIRHLNKNSTVTLLAAKPKAGFYNPSNILIAQRVEIDHAREEGRSTEVDLHLYEAFWAPLTEGVATLSDVIGFLFDGGPHGLLNRARPFRRAMFPGVRERPSVETACMQVHVPPRLLDGRLSPYGGGL